jgi:hypothetical protein
MSHRIADSFAPAADGATTRECYEIDIELPEEVDANLNCLLQKRHAVPEASTIGC